MYDVYAERSPNVYKVTICLAELRAEWRDIWLNVTTGEQHKPEFRRLSPNSRIPVLVDHAPIDGGEPQVVWESGAILLYLGEKTGQFLPSAPRDRVETLKWLFWQMAGLGPMSGQNAHFAQYDTLIAECDYAKKRYHQETLRLYGVLDTRLSGKDWIAGEYSIADMACYPWVRIHAFLGHNLAGLDNLTAWRDRMAARPAVVEAYRRMDELPASTATLEERFIAMSPEKGMH